MKIIQILFLFFLSAFSACAHHPDFIAEVSGPGVTQGERGGIVYHIPPTGETEFSLQVQSLGIRKAKEVQMLGVRMFFVRGHNVPSLKDAKEWIDPADLFLKLENGVKIKPAFLRSKHTEHSMIMLTGVQYDVIELLFPLCTSVAKNMGIFFLHWKIHYDNSKMEDQIASFDRSSSPYEPHEDQAKKDTSYPYDVNMIDADGWHMEQDPYWWAYDPWWPWN
jgi:hypothetical protein